MAARKKGLAHKPKNDAQWRVAVHEAGHAVAAHALGIRIERVTIVAGSTADGEHHAGLAGFRYEPTALRRALDEYYDAEEDDAEREEQTFFLLMKSMQASFGGKVAEELFFGGAEEAGLTPDLESINTCAEILCPPDGKEIREREVPLSVDMSMDEAVDEAIKRMPEMPMQEQDYFIAWVEHRARKLLRNRQDLVEDVAQKLLEEETLTGTQVVATILAALKKRWSRKTAPLARGASPAPGR